MQSLAEVVAIGEELEYLWHYVLPTGQNDPSLPSYLLLMQSRCRACFSCQSGLRAYAARGNTMPTSLCAPNFRSQAWHSAISL